MESGIRPNADRLPVYADAPAGAYDGTDLKLSANVPTSGGNVRPFLSIANLFYRDPRIQANPSPGRITP